MACKQYKLQEYVIPETMDYKQFVDISKRIVTHGAITFTCNKCGTVETMTKNRLLLRDDLICTNCYRENNIMKKFGSKEAYLKWRQEQQIKSFQNKYGDNVTNPSQIDGMQERKKVNHRKKHGVDSPMQRAEVKAKAKAALARHINENPNFWIDKVEKQKATCRRLWGVDNYAQTDEFKEKYKQICQEKWGVDNAFQSEEVKAKIIKTNKAKLGVSYPSQSKEVRSKIMETNRDHWGCNWSLSSPEIRERIQATNNERYGGNSPANSQEVRNAMVATNLKLYGVEYSCQCDEIKKRIMQTNNDKYGCDWYIESDDFKEKAHETNMRVYGTDDPGNLPEFREKAKQTSIEHWGEDNPAKSDIIRKTVIETNMRLYGHPNGPGIKKVLYDNIWFDSNWEVIFYKWLKWMNMEFKYHPFHLPYMRNHKPAHYHPDFLVGERLYEVKGDYFFNESGQLIDPYDNGKLQLEKQQCMIDHHVILLMNKEIYEMTKDLENKTYNFILPL